MTLGEHLVLTEADRRDYHLERQAGTGHMDTIETRQVHCQLFPNQTQYDQSAYYGVLCQKLRLNLIIWARWNGSNITSNHPENVISNNPEKTLISRRKYGNISLTVVLMFAKVQRTASSVFNQAVLILFKCNGTVVGC